MVKLPETEQFVEHFRDSVWVDVGRRIFRNNRIKISSIKRSDHGESVVLLGDDSYVLKIFNPNKRGFIRESHALELLNGELPIEVPKVAAAGQFEGYDFLITTRIPGRLVTKQEWLNFEWDDQVKLLAELADVFQTLHKIKAETIDFDWGRFVERNAIGAVERQRSEGGNPEWFESLPSFIDENLSLVPTDGPSLFLHGDVHFGNLRVVSDENGPRISGIFDFADSLSGFHEYDFVAVGVLMIQGQGDLQREFFRRYGYPDADINEEMRRRLMMLTILYESSSLRRYAERLSPGAVHLPLEELEMAIWSFA